MTANIAVAVTAKNIDVIFLTRYIGLCRTALLTGIYSRLARSDKLALCRPGKLERERSASHRPAKSLAAAAPLKDDGHVRRRENETISTDKSSYSTPRSQEAYIVILLHVLIQLHYDVLLQMCCYTISLLHMFYYTLQ